MSRKARISAVICTFNRCELLAETIASLATQSLDPSKYEVIVVDNASTDATSSVVQACIERWSDCQIRLVHEPKQGLSHARNTGFRTANGEFVAYLDDDVLAAHGWLEAGLETFETAETRPLAVVGPVLPRYPEGRPKWFLDSLETFDLGDSLVKLTRGQSFMGGNAMFTKHTLETLGGFKSHFGMTGNRLWLGEEVDLQLRMKKAFGSRACIYYDPRVRIDHAIPLSKLRVGYVLRRRYLNGQCKGQMQLENGTASRGGQIGRSLAWTARLSATAIAFCYRYRSLNRWLIERVAPIAVQLGQLRSSLRRTSQLQADEGNAVANDTIPKAA